MGVDAAGGHEPPVKVVETKTVGAYEIAVLATKDSGALASWLETNRFYFPTNKTDMLDYYVRQQWYFIAVKISLGPTRAKSSATANQLASGELNPLQISFASDRCIFPLKISSVNGKPSEIQLYVLSPEPLVEKAMLDKKLPQICSNDLVQTAKYAESFKNFREHQKEIDLRRGRFTPSSDPVEEKALADYAKALKADTLKNQADVLELAARLELGATNAYLGVIPSLKDPQLAKVAARLAADETMHWTILNNALGKPLPAGGLPFGA